jgi:hypothetical protein
MLGNVDVQGSPPVMTDYEEAVEHAERDRWDGEKVHRGDGFAMIAEKGEPTLGWLRIPGRSFYPTGDRSFRDIETKHEQFPMDAWRSPGRIPPPSGKSTLEFPCKSVFARAGFSLWKSVSNISESPLGATERLSPA